MRWLLALLMLASAASAQQGPTPASPDLERTRTLTGTVTGRILDHAGEPVVAAQVSWTTWNGCMLGEDGGTTTDGRGRFVLEEVPIEVDRLWISRVDVRRRDQARVAVRVDESVCVEVRLEPYASLEVTLDRPGVKAAVALMGVLEPGRWVPGIRLHRGRWVADWLGEGRTVVNGVWPGRQHLYVAILDPETDELSGWAETTVDLRPGENRIALAVERLSVIEGRVLDPLGRPVAGSDVRALPCDPGRAGFDHELSVVADEQLSDVTGDDGTYRMVLPGGTWRVIATPSDEPGPRAERRVHAPKGATEVVDLTLSVGRAITVRFTPPLGDDADVSVSGPPGVWLDIVDRSTLSLGGLLDGDRVNVVVVGEALGAHATLSVATPEVALALAPLAVVEVRIDSPACAGLEVELVPAWPARFPGSAHGEVGDESYSAPLGDPVTGGTWGRTDERGQVTLEGVVPGLYQVWIDGTRRGGLLEVAPGAHVARTF